MLLHITPHSRIGPDGPRSAEVVFGEVIAATTPTGVRECERR
jgi:hypothetical protein